MEFNSLKIKEFNFWSLFLHENQCYLGRTYLWAKRESAFDLFSDMNEEEKKELFYIGNILQKSIKSLFNHDLMNYAALQNTVAHLHVHFIPRYKTPRFFNEVEFIDDRFGQNYAPYKKEFQLDPSTIENLKQAIYFELKNNY